VLSIVGDAQGIGYAPTTSYQQQRDITMNSALHKPRQHYTVADYMSWQGDERYELIDGEAYLMAPAPVVEHQRITGNLYFGLRLCLKDIRPDNMNCTCEVFDSPIDVRLAPDTIVQPDVVLVCDPAKLANGKYIDGAPDLTVEVVSPSTGRMDRLVKRDLYERSGVQHYWLADPTMLTLEWYQLEAGTYGKPAVFGRGDVVTLPLCGGLTLQLDDIFGPEPVVELR
jgi:Uma2 family endonuclease